MPRRSPPPPLDDLQRALTPPPASEHARGRLVARLHDAARRHIEAGSLGEVQALRGWACAHPLFAPPDAPFRRYLALWEEALLSGLPLPEAAALLRDDARLAAASPWERIAVRATWGELRPLLADDAAGWSAAEARALRGDCIGGRSPASGLPLQIARWEPEPLLPLFSAHGGTLLSGHRFASRLAPTPLPPEAARLPLEPEWAALLAPWDAWDITEAVKIRGSALQAISTLLSVESDAAPSQDDPLPEARILACRCPRQEALRALAGMHGGMSPFAVPRGPVEARRAVWRLLAALAGLPWPTSGAALERAMRGWRWWRYNPEEPDDPPDDWTLFLAVEDPRRGLAWAVYGWVID